ncbi:hypothetical protein XELAEV_18031503mg [Xenopus laevis]|uniref:GIY-YIG domain-containing protein n=1 Tax=Xenopus laevis TaxID=8355 RepID=A0A974CNX6_XENLA|nr:hypothetical protein XELAEV_18031503mg [Xenopus laevis]
MSLFIQSFNVATVSAVDVTLDPGTDLWYPQKWTAIKIKGYHTCLSFYAVYSVKYPCGLMYVGQTTRQIKDRIWEHKSDIKRNVRQNPMACHFVDTGHTVAQPRFQILQHIPILRRGGDRAKQLLKCEAGWIRRLGTITPGGLNKEYELNSLI